MSASLVGSEMCIRDRGCKTQDSEGDNEDAVGIPTGADFVFPGLEHKGPCLLYTSDAADDM
eukprot:3537399-Alexandrium_andersonii.AAC.1